MLKDEYDPKYVRLSNIEWFNVSIDPTCITVGQLRELSNKVVEEAAETMVEGKRCIVEADRTALEDEIADVIQASCNLAAAFGIFDLRPAIERCIKRNEQRGRISKRITDNQLEFLKKHSISWFTDTEDGL